MADLFTSIVAISPNQSKTGGKQAERTPGTSPQMKDGIWNERASTVGGYPNYTKGAALNASVQATLIKSASLNGSIIPPISIGLVSYYKLDGNSTDSLAANNGTDTAITYSGANGVINSGAGFNGSTSFINLGSAASLHLTGAMSFFTWAKNVTTTNFHMMLTRGPSGTSTYEFRFEQTTGRLAFINGGTFLNSGFAPTLGAWHHVGFTRTSGNVIAIYSDGVQVSTATIGAPTSNPASSTFIGKRADGFFMDGAIDEAGIWSRALSAEEVTVLYNGGSGVQYPF